MATKTKTVKDASVNGSNRITEHLEATEAKAGDVKTLVIQPLKQEVVKFRIVGDAPLVINRFSRKAMDMMKSKQELGSQAQKGRKRDAKDFQECYENARHLSKEGWDGIPSVAFRAAMISACRLCSFKMTHGKQSVFIEADGFDAVDGIPLTKITKGEPRYVEHAVRNASGVADIRARPMWDTGWEAMVTVRYDSELFTASDVLNLLHRAGQQVGIMEGRPDSKESVGQGWGTFRVSQSE